MAIKLSNIPFLTFTEGEQNVTGHETVVRLPHTGRMSKCPKNSKMVAKTSDTRFRMITGSEQNFNTNKTRRTTKTIGCTYRITDGCQGAPKNPKLIPNRLNFGLLFSFAVIRTHALKSKKSNAVCDRLRTIKETD